MKIILDIALIISIFGCSKSEYRLDDKIHYSDSIEIISEGGNTQAKGPFRLINGPTGHANQPLSYRFKTSTGEYFASQKAIQGFHFSIDGYENEKGELFWVILKIPSQP
ncbi:MAG: hypothetical protein PF795_10525 [Kiritimatiellae bacterium]|jgi:hypothetical protein|nr:hypothetical protein [Kiritimatiellia bacterium]